MYDFDPNIDLESDWQKLLPLFAVGVIVLMMAAVLLIGVIPWL